ncbi:MAG: calcium-binding protein [Pirellulales bacterium]|nr:calcium-binding protein [Pirellulales bacterium]
MTGILRHRSFVFLFCGVLTGASVACWAAESATLQPGDPVDYGKLAFYPERWRQHHVSTRLVPWEGQRVVLLTAGSEFDREVMARFLQRLDGGWKTYAALVGSSPQPLKQINGKPTIAALPRADLSCGYGCGYIGAAGIEVAGFYDHDYPLVQNDRDAFAHYYFYEMGRNYYTFGERHSLFITGYAVFMRIVCTDVLGCRDPDRATRRTIEQAEQLYADSGMGFLEAFTTLGGLDEKTPRLTRTDGRPVQPSDQPVIYASAMLKLRRDCGGEPWVKRFFAELAKCPQVKPATPEDALQQCYSWLVAASCAARKDLSGTFVDRWRLPLAKETRQALLTVRWEDPTTTASVVLQDVPATFAPR